MNANLPAEHAQILVEPAAYADGRIYRTYDWLRANMPLGKAQVEGFDPFWVATRYDDVRAISRDNIRFPVGDRSVVLVDRKSDAFTRRMSGGKPYLQRSILEMDPPEHIKYRLMTQSWFMPKNLRSIEAAVQEMARQAIAALKDGPVVDFAAHVGLHYPLRVIMHILGVPDADLPLMLRLTQQIFAPADPDSDLAEVDRNDPDFMGKAWHHIIAQFDAYFRRITADRLENPRDDLATVIAHAQFNGQPLPDADRLGYYMIVATAGHDTTSASLANAMHALATDAALFQRVRDDLELVPQLVEEAIRHATPVKTFMRSVAKDVSLSGRDLRAGDWVMLCYASANRDETYFPDAGEFRIDRTFTEHLSFGYGPHVCLGQHLARMELRNFLHHLLPQIHSVRLAGPTAKSESWLANGFKRLPLEFTWA